MWANYSKFFESNSYVPKKKTPVSLPAVYQYHLEPVGWSRATTGHLSFWTTCDKSCDQISNIILSAPSSLPVFFFFCQEPTAEELPPSLSAPAWLEIPPCHRSQPRPGPVHESRFLICANLDIHACWIMLISYTLQYLMFFEYVWIILNQDLINHI